MEYFIGNFIPSFFTFFCSCFVFFPDLNMKDIKKPGLTIKLDRDKFSSGELVDMVYPTKWFIGDGILYHFG